MGASTVVLKILGIGNSSVSIVVVVCFAGLGVAFMSDSTVLRRVVLQLLSGLRRLEGWIDAEVKDIPQNPEGHSLVRIGRSYVLYQEVKIESKD